MENDRKKEGQTLKQLKSIATVKSVGASTRIEGSKLSDEEVDTLLKNLAITKLEDRDSQEVVGYFETLDLISEAYENIDVKESGIKSLHNLLMRPAKKDAWHKGNYKQHDNAVEATYPDGSRQTIFQTTKAGFETEEAMRQLIEWYETDKETHVLVKISVFVYEFLSIHPFQDGNGRLSRLLSTLLLLKNKYLWIQFISFEHEIENRKTEYYRVLRTCQSNRPNENVSIWILFFFEALQSVQKKLLQKLKQSGTETQLSPREKSIIAIIANHPGIKSGDLANRLSIPNPTMKRIISQLLQKEIIQKHGGGRNTNYSLN